MFFFKKKRSEESAVTKEESLKNFTRKIPYGGYRPVDYEILKNFENLMPVLDSMLQKLFQGGIDEGNDNVLDSIICDVAGEALLDLERQKIRHRDVIEDLRLEFLSNKAGFQQALGDAEIELKELEAELETIRKRMK